MFPALTSVDVTDADGFGAAMRTVLDVDGPRWSALNAQPTKSRPARHFLGRQ